MTYGNMGTTKKSDDVALAEAFGALAEPKESEPGEAENPMELSFGKGVSKRTILVTQGITVNKFVESSQ